MLDAFESQSLNQPQNQQPTYTLEEYINEYNSLCKKMGYRISAEPKFVPTNHGTFELSFDLKVAKFQENL